MNTIVKTVGTLAACGLLSAGPAMGATVILVDLNNANSPGGDWNTIGSTSASNVALNSTEGATSIQVSLSGGFLAGGADAAAGTNFDSSVSAAAGDAFYVGEAETGTLTFTGFDANSQWTVEIVSSRSTPASTGVNGSRRLEAISVNGSFTSDSAHNNYVPTTPVAYDYGGTSSDHVAGEETIEYNFNAYHNGSQRGELLTFSANAGAGGEIVIDISSIDDPFDTSGDTFAYINAVRLTEVPEPGSLALLGLGGLALLGRRRRDA